jgi:NAD(P)-dependent dehydrogenase (short-subunit alcohol dehydrogenase family)
MRSLQDLMDLRDRTALITGGAGYIGQAAAAVLGELGCRVALCDLGSAEPADVAKEIQAVHGCECIGIACDLGISAEIHALPERLEKFTGHLDILINNAALVGTSELKGWAVPFPSQSEDSWRKALDINLTAAFLISQVFAPQMQASGHGSIINIASIYGVAAPDWSLYEGTALGNPAAYGVSKAGLIQLSKWLAAALAPNVRVNAISPGGILRGQQQEFVERYERHTLLARMGREEDLKGAIAYLASDLSAYVTGHNLIVDGGWTI